MTKTTVGPALIVAGLFVLPDVKNKDRQRERRKKKPKARPPPSHARRI
ncbi:MAG: hypothetical protein HYT79_08390 [Elusimicrobia bacterium]|nr:hypothetical protein [Elusimicrobiota bacterium]